jgi:hypothetical protein
VPYFDRLELRRLIIDEFKQLLRRDHYLRSALIKREIALEDYLSTREKMSDFSKEFLKNSLMHLEDGVEVLKAYMAEYLDENPSHTLEDAYVHYMDTLYSEAGNVQEIKEGVKVEHLDIQRNLACIEGLLIKDLNLQLEMT